MYRPGIASQYLYMQGIICKQQCALEGNLLQLSEFIGTKLTMLKPDFYHTSTNVTIGAQYELRRHFENQWPF